jgi:signal transduction histidine kinase
MVTLQLENLYMFLENNYDYLLVVDTDERVVYVSQLLLRDCCPENHVLEGKYLRDILTPQSLNTFKSAMALAKAGNRGIAVYTPSNETGTSIPLKPGYADMEGMEIFLFFGNRLENISRLDGWEKDERIKELSCLYAVMDLIEYSRSIDDFFTRLPRCLAPGMLYPDEVVIYSEYQGVEYGQKPAEDCHMSVKLVVGQTVKGEIKVGYLDAQKREILPDEQKLVNEIGRALSLALERKELRDRMTMKQDEEADFMNQLKELEQEISRKTNELEAQENKLNIVNSYLNRVNQGWEESKARLETMFQAIPDEVVLLDTKRRVLMTNRDDIIPGDYCFKSFFNRDRPCQDCRLARIMKDKTPLTLTIKDENRYLEVHALPFYDQNHEVDGILEFYRDVTLEKTYEQQLQQADKLASLGQLVSGIGHEINNPNQFIRGNIKIIRQTLEDVLPIVDEYQKTHPDLEIARLKYNFFRQHIMTLVEDMSHGSERIKGIVEGLRTFVRKDEGLLVDSVDINTLIEASARLVHNQVHKRADIDLELEDKLPTFKGNSQKLEQVLINLIVNAGDAMLDDVKGLVTIRTKLEGSEIVVEVEDNGRGMDQKTLKQIFDPFFTTKRAKGGTGLGLAIAYNIIEEHGGKISVTSKVGEGTIFMIRIPFQASTSETTREKP